MPTIQPSWRSVRLWAFMKAFSSSIPEIATIEPISLSLRSEKPMSHPLRAVAVGVQVFHLGHEVPVAAEDDDDQQVHDQRHVHQRARR